MPIIAFAAAFPLCISTARTTPKIPAAHGRGRGARRMDGTSTEQSTEHRRNNGTSTEHRRNIDGTSTEHRITYERAPPRTRGGRGPEGTGKALKPPQPKRKSKFYVFDGTPLTPPLADLLLAGAGAGGGMAGAQQRASEHRNRSNPMVGK